MNPDTASQTLVLDLVADFEQLRPLLDTHLVEQEGELLPYLLLDDVVRWCGEAVADDPATVAAVLDWLEHAYGRASSEGDGAVMDLIGVGFVEMVPASPEGDPVLHRLGPRLRGLASEFGLVERAEPTDPGAR